MPYFRIFFVAVICAFCAGVDVSAQFVRTQQGTGAKTTYDAISTAKTRNDKICQEQGKPCRGYGALTPSNCTEDLKCPIKDCDNSRGFYYVVYQENPDIKQYKKMGWCANVANCNSVSECKNKNCRLVTTTLDDGMRVAIQQPTGQKAPSRKFLCEVFDDICTPDALNAAYAKKGDPIIPTTRHEDDYCKPTLCIDGYILPDAPITKENASCKQCPPCDPGTGANCEPNGSNGEYKCRYNTSCKDGYGNIQRDGEYNPECSPNEYNIKLVSAPGSGCQDTKYTYGVGTTIDCQPTRQDYDFAGWCDNPDTSENCNTTRTIDTKKMGDITFYAKWIEKDCKNKYKNEAEIACICTFEKKWVNDTCECGDGQQWNSAENKCEAIPECDGQTVGHTKAYQEAIKQILNSFKKRANDLCTTKGWELNDTTCAPTKKSEEPEQVQEQEEK